VTAAAAEAPRRRARWGRRLLIFLLVLVVLRLLLGLLLPWFIGIGAGFANLDARVGSSSLSLLGGHLQLEDLELRPEGGFEEGAPDTGGVSLGAFDADLQLSALFTGRLCVTNLAVEELVVDLVRDADHHWPLLDALLGRRPGASSGGPGPADPPAVTDLRPPFEIDHLVVQPLRLRLVDHAQAEPSVTQFDGALRLSNLRGDGRDAQFELRLTGRDALDVLRVDGTLAAAREATRASVQVDLVGLRLARLQPALEAAGLRAAVGRLDGGVRLLVDAAVEGDALSASLELNDARLLGDGVELLALDSLAARLDALAPGRLALGEVVLTGPRASLAVRADGAPSAAGVDLVRLPAAPATSAPPTSATPSGPVAIALKHFGVRDLLVHVSDERRGPQATLALQLPEMSFGPLDSAAGDGAANLNVQLAVPGVVQSVTVTGSIAPFGSRPSARLELLASGLDGPALDPWLASLGWASDYSEGTVGGRLEASSERDASGVLRGTAALSELRLADAAGERATLAGVVASGVQLDPSALSLRIGELSIQGPVVGAERDAQGVVHVAGLRQVPAVPLLAAPAEPAAAAPPAADDAPPAGPRPSLAIDAIRWQGADLSIHDVSVSPAVDLHLRPVMEGSGLALGGDAAAGELVVHVGADGVWQDAELRCTLHAGDAPGDLAATVVLAARDVQPRGLSGWLAAAGADARGMHAQLGATLELQLGSAISVRVADALWQDGETTVFSMPELRVQGVRAGGGALRVAGIEMPALDLTVSRDAHGVLSLGELCVKPPGPPESEAPAAPVVPPAAPPVPPGAPRVLALEKLRVGSGGARVHWRDATVSPALDLVLSGSATLDGLVVGGPAPPAPLRVEFAAPGVCEGGSWSGTVSLAPEAQALTGELDVHGVRFDALAAYLPPGCRSTLKDGRFTARVAASLGAGAQGGQRAELKLSEVAWRDGEAPPFVSLEALSLVASRIDPEAGVAAVDEIVVSGAELHAERHADGTLALMGLELLPPMPGGTAPAEPTAPASAPAPEAPPTAAAEPLPLPAARRPPPPFKDLRVERVDLELRRFDFADTGAAGAAPLVFAARVRSTEPLILADRSLEEQPPCKLEVRASALPIARALEADVSFGLAGPRAELTLELRADGLRGAGITEVLPELAAWVDGSGLTDGSARGRLDAQLRWPRRAPLDLDLSGGVSGNIALTDVACRAQPEGEVLLGLDSLEVQLGDVRPGGIARISSVELTGIKARLGVSPEALDVLGVHVKLPELPAAPPEDAPPAAPPPPAPLGPEVRIDLLSMSELDVILRDDSCTPPMILPLTDLDLQVRGWSSHAAVVPRPLRFSALVRGGDVPLPRRHEASSLLAGMLGAATRAASGGSDVITLENRPVFDELTLQGRIVQAPEPTGWVNLTLSSLELPAFVGPAQQEGVIIGDGTLDATARLRLNGADGHSVDARLTFTYLSLDEPENGPITRWLHLPAPLDTVLFLLKNNNGEQIIKLSFDVPQGGLGGGRVAAATGRAMSSSIARAVASSPLRVLGTVTDAVGITGGDAAPPEPPLVLDFGPGDAALPAGAAATLDWVAARLHHDEDLGLLVEHSFSAGDAERALLLGNPPPEVVLLVAERLRLERAELLRHHDVASAEARSLLAVGRQAEADAAAARLLEADRQLGAREESLDRVLELLDAGASRRAPKRARAVGVEFGEARLAQVRERLAAAGGPEILERVQSRPVRYAPDEQPGGGHIVLTLKPRPESGGFFSWLFGWIPELFESDPGPPPAPPPAPPPG
jgi:Domain of Unknown Function (DUF748)